MSEINVSFLGQKLLITFSFS